MEANPKMVMGLYKYVRDGKFHEERYKKVVNEMYNFFKYNRIENLNEFSFLAGDSESAEKLENLGLRVEKAFDEVPQKIKKNKAHLMKHYMVIWAIEKYKEVLWVDWDVLILKWPDKVFWDWCRSYGTPKFIYIPNYWAKVNCGVYYTNTKWSKIMKRILRVWNGEPNDELLWAAILPEDIKDRNEYWFGDMAINIWDKEDIFQINKSIYFAHVRTFDYYHIIKKG